MPDVEKDKRVLLVVANLETHGDESFRGLYDWLEKNAIRVAQFMMKPFYRKVVSLGEWDATYARFLNCIRDLAHEPETRALDVFLHLHGSPDQLYFQDDGGVDITRIAEDIEGMYLKDRLRLLYSTACYGGSHAAHFVGAGFRVASGAKGINANGVYDYPRQMRAWAAGRTYKYCVRRGNNEDMIKLWDQIAETVMGLSGINSYKVICGRNQTKITTEAD